MSLTLGVQATLLDCTASVIVKGAIYAYRGYVYVRTATVLRSTNTMLGEVKGRWSRELTEAELSWTVRQSLKAVEWEDLNQTFFAHEDSMRIIRTNAAGADVRVVHGGWQYPNSVAFLLDWTEIKYVGERRKR